MTRKFAIGSCVCIILIILTVTIFFKTKSEYSTYTYDFSNAVIRYDYSFLPGYNYSLLVDTYKNDSSDLTGYSYKDLYKTPLNAGIEKAERDVWLQVKSKVDKIINEDISFNVYLEEKKNQIKTTFDSSIQELIRDITSKYLVTGGLYKFFYYNWMSHQTSHNTLTTGGNPEPFIIIPK
jgi:hypothetical protein